MRSLSGSYVNVRLFFDGPDGPTHVGSIFSEYGSCSHKRNQVTDVFRGGHDTIAREGSRSAFRTTFLQRGDLAGTTTHSFSTFFRAPESLHVADEVVAVCCIPFNWTRDASHIQVHSFSLTSKRPPSVPDTPSEQPLVLPGWCLLLFAPLLCRPLSG